MNTPDYMTHWNGVPLKELSHGELINVCQELYRALEKHRIAAIVRNQPKSETFSSF